jgi:periplasmic divalent cation tolerance protein
MTSTKPPFPSAGPSTSPSADQAIVMVTTVGDEEQANEIARELVLRRHAACVNILPGVRSVYRWKGKICRDSEFLLIVKTMAHEFEAVRAAIHELHAYELPEILAFDISRGDRGFLDWIGQSLDKDAEFGDEEDLPDLDAL